jgi:hypothetical protein
MARLAALVPPPRMHLARYHGVFAPHSKLRAAVTTAGRGLGKKPSAEEGTGKAAAPRHVAMTWAKRLKRVFGIDIGLRALRREAQGDCQHRGAGGDREDSGAPGAYGTGAVPSRAAARGEGAAGAVPAVVNLKMWSACRRSTRR